MKYPEFVESKIFYSLEKSKSEIKQLTAISEDLKKSPSDLQKLCSF